MIFFHGADVPLGSGCVAAACSARKALMLSGAVTGRSSSAAGSGAGFATAPPEIARGLTAASVSLRGAGAASADLRTGLATGAKAKDGFGFGIGIGSMAAVTIGAVADAGAV